MGVHVPDASDAYIDKESQGVGTLTCTWKENILGELGVCQWQLVQRWLGFVSPRRQKTVDPTLHGAAPRFKLYSAVFLCNFSGELGTAGVC